jgi:peptidoglycan hydrolase-like protein with peptidoglycan-binding domain
MSDPTDSGTDPSRRDFRRRPRIRAAVLAGVALATLAVAGAATLGLGGRGEGEPAPRRSGPAATTTITRQTLVKAVTLPGELGYGTPVPLTSTAPGTVTWLPEVGATVRRGRALLRVDEQPVVLLYGFLPMYRALTADLTGSDVRQFERNLAALGYDGFTVDDTFSSSTTAAVKRWQKDLGLAETGTVDRERVIYAPDAVRIAQRLVRVGASATGDVLSYTGNTKIVTVTASAGKTAWAARGTKLTVGLPDGKSVSGEVTGVATEAQPAPGGAAAAEGDSANPGTGGATVAVTVAVTDQKALGTFSSTPVDVRYIDQQRKDVLTVPVNALLALAEGSYGLEVVGDGAPRIVAVEAGLFADGRVEVRGEGLTEGLTVGIPE